jgi:hypothetical protein
VRPPTKKEGDMGKRFAIVIGMAAAGVMALGAQTTTAAPEVVKYDTELTITADRGPFFHGFVDVRGGEDVRKCEVERRVVLFRQRPGPDAELGTDRSEPTSHHSGGWGVKVPRAQAGWRVYAKAKHKVRDRYVCLADRSETYTWG